MRWLKQNATMRAVLIAWPALVPAAELKRVELPERGLLRPDRPLAGLSAFVDIEPVQADVDKGIEFTLTLVNDTGRSVTLWHSWKSVRAVVYNEQRVRLDVPDKLSKAAHKVRGGEVSHETWENHNARRTLKYIDSDVAPATGTKTIGAIGNEPERFTITLASNEKLVMRFRIGTIMGDAERWWADVEAQMKAPLGTPPPPQPQAIPIPPGTYELLISIHVWEAEKETGPSFSSDRIKVRLGAPPAETRVGESP